MARSRLPVRITLSYVFDWVVVVLLAAGGGILYYITGYHRPFSLTDISIAYPDNPNIISIPVLVIVAFAIPILIIGALNVASHIPGLNFHSSRGQSWHQTIWETHIAILGLCASQASTLFLTSGIKDMIGKPRPNLLARCNADLSKITGFAVGGFGQTIDSEAEVLVTSGICRQPDHRTLDDSFAAFPSGHTSFAFAGLLYLSFWLCARFALTIPYLNIEPSPQPQAQDHPSRRLRNKASKSLHLAGSPGQAAPPLWQLAFALVPAVVALFIACSRYADFHHAGIDIFAGAVLGSVMAWASFRLFHLPMRRARGLVAWSHRESGDAFVFSARKIEQDNVESSGNEERGAAYELNETNPESRGAGMDGFGGRQVRVHTQDSSAPMFR